MPGLLGWLLLSIGLVLGWLLIALVRLVAVAEVVAVEILVHQVAPWLSRTCTRLPDPILENEAGDMCVAVRKRNCVFL